MPPYKVLVVEDEQIIRKNIVGKVNRANGAFYVCADVSSGMDAWKQIQILHPHVVLIDINIPEINGLELARLIKSRYPKIIPVIISGYSNFDYARQAIGYGAFEYLLKPVKQDSISEVLGKIKLKLDLSALGNTRDVVCIGGSDEAAYKLPSESPGKLSAMLVCVGNLAAPFPDGAQSRLHEKLWASLDLQKLLTEIWPEQSVLWLVDEVMGNQKLLLFPSLPDKKLYKFSEILLDSARKLVDPYPVHVFRGSPGVYYSEIWDQTNLIRAYAEQRLTAGKSEIADLGAAMNAPSVLLSQDALFKLHVLLCNDTEAFRKEFVKSMSVWDGENRPQREIEAEIAKFFQYVLSQNSVVGHPHSEDAERELALSSALSPDMESWALKASEIFISLTAFENISGTEDIALKAKHFIDHNFTSAISIEEIAHHFAFSQTYLTKIFKKHCGVAPIKYLILLRISKAKQLFGEHPDIDVKEVALSVGYDDQHYFSRIFKNVVGQSPSDYRHSQKRDASNTLNNGFQ